MKRILILCLTVALTGATAVYGAPPPDPASQSGRAARVDSVDVKGGSVVLDDTKYLVSPALTITTASGGSLRLDSLRKGSIVGFVTVQPTGGKGRPQIVKMWLLPSDYRFPDNN